MTDLPTLLATLEDDCDTLVAGGFPREAGRVRELMAGYRAMLGLDAPHGLLMATARPRSGKWPKVERDYLRGHPECCVCGRPATVGHHVIPVHVDPARELDPANLIGFCGPVEHLQWGHAGNWSWSRPDVRDVTGRERRFRELLREAPRAP